MKEILCVAFILLTVIFGGELLLGWISGRVEFLIVKDSPLRMVVFLLGLLSFVAAVVWFTVNAW